MSTDYWLGNLTGVAAVLTGAWLGGHPSPPVGVALGCATVALVMLAWRWWRGEEAGR